MMYVYISLPLICSDEAFPAKPSQLKWQASAPVVHDVHTKSAERSNLPVLDWNTLILSNLFQS
jgi:hypothetical protein